ncbi:unnamed protein product [Rotaria sp. Silwood2]|nr:unnamed protein product [Rotaria sp. Silwood2]CAF3147520.1 unnamed protein product [Rotaria sp. Silwood2]CAF3439224.1 unnamed protein product [Rotaria sp. Silwood2]CAF4546784.1 unnamed protein product [Rotaria sp. Silwood2]CAF4555538.1 unnamed protein product [Rotaria sp. Silwood2]
MRRFASSVYTLGGRNVYEFLRLNLPGAFPSILTLDSYNSEYCARVEEGEFRFDELFNYLTKTNCLFVYASEDCSAIVSKIHYNVVIVSDIFKKDRQNYASCLKISSPNVLRMLDQMLSKKLPVESLNIFIFSSQPCENIFRIARALTGPFSSITNFTLQQFLAKTRKMSILNEIKSIEELNLDSNAIKFPIHHKQSQNRQNRKSTYDAYEYAKSFSEKLEMSSLLKKNNVFKLNDLCANMRNDLEKMIYITDHSVFDPDDDPDEDSDDSSEEVTTFSSVLDENSESDGEYVDTENECTKSTKDGYNGMRIYSTVADKEKKVFFKITIDGKEKYMHKQTAVCYLSKKHSRLSSDRLVRVQKTDKQ